jgi:hypothetical protein
MVKRRKRPLIVLVPDPSRRAHAQLIAGPVVELKTPPGRLTVLMIKKLRKRIKRGDMVALLDAVDLCARSGIPLPTWLATDFCNRFMKWRLFHAKSLDEAFAVTRKRMRIKSRATDEWLKLPITLEVLSKDAPIGEEMFELVGKKFGVGKTTAKDIYYGIGGKAPNPWLKFLPD